jgi:transposase
MAYREVDMWEILEVLRRLHRRETNAAIERATGRTRKTIRRYKQRARKLGWQPGGEKEPDEELAVAVGQSLRPVTESEGLGTIEARLMPQRAAITEWVSPADGSRGLRLSKVHDLLGRQGVDVAYSSLHRFAVRYCGFHERQRVTVRVAEVAPGELAEVDFGRLGLVYDPDKGRRRVAWALLVTLAHSRHQYLHVTFSQTLADFIEGMEDAWEYFGGVPRRVVIDNLKAAVSKAGRYESIFQRTFDEYATHRGFVIDAAVVRHATGKPKVERNVQYVRESFFRGESWVDLEHVRREAVRWCTEVAGKRVHGSTRQQPLVVFTAVEREALSPLKAERFDPPTWQECKVHPDHHIQFDKALYSLPTRYVGRQVWVRADRKVVRAYCGGELVKSYARQEPGGRYTDYEDYPRELAPYAMRDPQRMIREAHEVGPHVGRFMAELLDGTFPWAHLRQAQKLLRLANRYGHQRLDGACRRALSFDLIHVGRVENIVRQSLEREATPNPRSRSTQLRLVPTTRFLRPAGSFTHANPIRNMEEVTYDGSQPVPEDGPQASETVGDRPHAP